MIKAISAEFKKTKRRKIWLIVTALIGVQLLWAFWGFGDMNERELRQGWMLCLYQFPVLNAIMMPVITAVIASRLSDIEHKGETFRLLNTVMPAGILFDAKFLCGSCYIISLTILQVGAIFLTGHVKGFTEPAPLVSLGYYFLFTLGVSLTLLLFQQVLSLLFANQMVPLSIGLLGGFAGLFIMYLPPQLAKLLLWGYYGVLMLVGMNWERETRIIDFYWTPIDWTGFFMLIGAFLIIYGLGRILFIRKEM